MGQYFFIAPSQLILIIECVIRSDDYESMKSVTDRHGVSKCLNLQMNKELKFLGQLDQS